MTPNPNPEAATNVLYCGDCKHILKKIPDESIDLIYLDPPFFSRKEYENFWIKDKVITLKFSDKDWEALRHSIDPVILKEYEEIEERWKSGHKGIYVCIAYMRERIEQCWRVLKSTGTIYLHCDWHAGHYLKVMMDGIFGYDNLLNEIVWCYETAGKSKKWFSRKNDIILLYRKSKNYFLDVSRSPMPRKRNKHMKLGIDENGREYEEKTDAKTKKVYRWYFDEGRLPFDAGQILISLIGKPKKDLVIQHKNQKRS